MNPSMIIIFVCAVVSVTAVVMSLYGSPSKRRLRDDQACWNAFVGRHRQLDRELDLIWHLLDR